MKQAQRLAIRIAILVAGAAGRISLLDAYPFHADEALFATLARQIADGSDPLLAETTLLVDKPPLFYAILSLGVSLKFGSDLTARLPGLFAGMIAIALMGRIGKRLWGSDRAGTLAMTLMMASPLMILTSPAALADPFMLAAWLGAIVAALEGRTFFTALLAALAICLKQNALFILPLPLLLWLAYRNDDETRSAAGTRLLAGCAIPLSATAFIEALRPGGWAMLAGGAVNNPGRLARSSELWPHLWAWGKLIVESVGGLAPAILIAISLIVVAQAGQRDGRQVINARLIGAVTIANGALLWLVAFPLFDRYLIPIEAMLLMLAAGGWEAAITKWGDEWTPLTTGLPVACMAVAGILAISLPAGIGPFSTGGEGLEEVVSTITQYPEGTVVYTETQGWQLRWKLYDAPVYLAVYANPDALAEDIRAHQPDGSARLLVVAEEEPIGPLYQAIAMSGSIPCLVGGGMNRYGQVSYMLIQIIPQEAGICPPP